MGGPSTSSRPWSPSCISRRTLGISSSHGPKNSSGVDAIQSDDEQTSRHDLSRALRRVMALENRGHLRGA